MHQPEVLQSIKWKCCTGGAGGGDLGQIPLIFALVDEGIQLGAILGSYII